MMEGVLGSRLIEAGAVPGELAGRRVVRHFGDSAAEYATVRRAVGLACRSDLALLRMWGRDPVRMLNGLITNDLAGAPAGQGIYGAMLTPKGRTVAELRVFRRTGADGPELLVAIPAEAAEATRDHLKKFVPPLFARWQELAAEEAGVLGLYGPGAAEVLDALVGARPEPGEDRYVEAEWEGETLLAARTLDAGGEDGYDLFVPAPALPALWDSLLAREAVRPVGSGVLETLRIEAGRPRYGAELTDETIPTEAYQETGLLERAISFSKGCYTGQEVIVRIAHRGHVNRHLRGLLLGDAPVPAPRTPLYHVETGKQVGWTTSAAVSPRLGQTVALGYVRREAEPGAQVALGSADGDRVEVVRLPFGTASSS